MYIAGKVQKSICPNCMHCLDHSEKSHGASTEINPRLHHSTLLGSTSSEESDGERKVCIVRTLAVQGTFACTPYFLLPLSLPSFLLSLFHSLPSIIPPSLSLSFPLLLFLPPDLPSPLFLRRPLMQPCQHWIAYWNQRDQKGVWIDEIGSHIGLFTAPYCCLEYRKAGRPSYPFSREHDIIGKRENFSELTGNILFKRLHAKHSVCMTVAPQ